MIRYNLMRYDTISVRASWREDWRSTLRKPRLQEKTQNCHILCILSQSTHCRLAKPPINEFSEDTIWTIWTIWTVWFELNFVTKITNTTFERMVHTLKTHVLRIDLNFVTKIIDTTWNCMWPVLRCIEALFKRCQMFVVTTHRRLSLLHTLQK